MTIGRLLAHKCFFVGTLFALYPLRLATSHGRNSDEDTLKYPQLDAHEQQQGVDSMVVGGIVDAVVKQLTSQTGPLARMLQKDKDTVKAYAVKKHSISTSDDPIVMDAFLHDGTTLSIDSDVGGKDNALSWASSGSVVATGIELVTDGEQTEGQCTNTATTTSFTEGEDAGIISGKGCKTNNVGSESSIKNVPGKTNQIETKDELHARLKNHVEAQVSKIISQGNIHPKEGTHKMEFKIELPPDLAAALQEGPIHFNHGRLSDLVQGELKEQLRESKLNFDSNNAESSPLSSPFFSPHDSLEDAARPEGEERSTGSSMVKIRDIAVKVKPSSDDHVKAHSHSQKAIYIPASGTDVTIVRVGTGSVTGNDVIMASGKLVRPGSVNGGCLSNVSSGSNSLGGTVDKKKRNREGGNVRENACVTGRKKATPSTSPPQKSERSGSDEPISEGTANEHHSENIYTVPLSIHHEDILLSLGLTSYPKECAPDTGAIIWSFLRDRTPASFRRYDCSRLLRELEYHQSNSGFWSERAVLEDLFFTLVDASPRPRNPSSNDIGNMNGDDSVLEHRKIKDFKSEKQTHVETWTSHSLIKYDGWLNDDISVSHCTWGGVTCGYTTLGMGLGSLAPHGDNENSGNEKQGDLPKRMKKNRCDENHAFDDWNDLPCPSFDSVTKLDLTHLHFSGTLPDNLYMLKNLHRLNLMGNQIKGTIPISFGMFERLEFLDVSDNMMHGPIPNQLPLTLTELWLENNGFTGTIPAGLARIESLSYLDLSKNSLWGDVPLFFTGMASLDSLYLGSNGFTHSIPEFHDLINLQVLDLSDNELTGTIPSGLSSCCPKLEELDLGFNNLKGTMPDFSGLQSLRRMSLKYNNIIGPIPDVFYANVGSTLRELDLSHNYLTGTLSPEIHHLDHIEYIYLQWNRLNGTLPYDLGFGSLETIIYLNLTENQFTGTVPMVLCVHQGLPFVDNHGCDAILCSPGTFNPNGAASFLGPCLPCPNHNGAERSGLLGQSTCLSRDFRVGDIDGDGTLSQREILRLFFAYTSGHHWGDQFKSWADMETSSCDLPGVSCNLEGEVIKINPKDARLCRSFENNESFCLGIPSEIGLLRSLEILDLSESDSLKGTLPTEIGQLNDLSVLDLSHCSLIRGSIPSEIGLLDSLRTFSMPSCSLSGTLPSTFGLLQNLVTLNLGLNEISGPIPSALGNMSSLTELILSRCSFTGTIPATLSSLKRLENLELYGNSLTGSIPSSLGKCSMLKRIDVFANELTSTIPTELTRIGPLQIIHLKANRLTGTLPPSMATLPILSWFDISGNQISGTIPSSYGQSPTLRDLRLGGNLLQGPIPESLCNNDHLNDGLTNTFGCDAILCPLGTYSDAGFATENSGCKRCPEGQSSMNLGSDSCQEFTQKDLLRMFYHIVGGESWHESQKRGWNSLGTECKWEGISCDASGDIERFSFPVAGLKNLVF